MELLILHVFRGSERCGPGNGIPGVEIRGIWFIRMCFSVRCVLDQGNSDTHTCWGKCKLERSACHSWPHLILAAYLLQPLSLNGTRTLYNAQWTFCSFCLVFNAPAEPEHHTAPHRSETRVLSPLLYCMCCPASAAKQPVLWSVPVLSTCSTSCDTETFVDLQQKCVNTGPPKNTQHHCGQHIIEESGQMTQHAALNPIKRMKNILFMQSNDMRGLLIGYQMLSILDKWAALGNCATGLPVYLHSHRFKPLTCLFRIKSKDSARCHVSI